MTRIDELRAQERQLTKLINKWHAENEFRLVILYGTGGIGKTSYAMQTLKQVDPKGYRHRFIFPPSQFVQTVTYLRENNMRIPALVWDDMGFWMYSLDYSDPFVKAAIKFFNVARTVVSCIIGTTASMKMLTSAVRNMDAMSVKVVSATAKEPVSLAKGYRQSIQPNMMRLVKTVFEDEYPRHMEDDDFAWYKPLRDSYVNHAISLMQESIMSRSRRPMKT
ncbi:hypothetical protein NTE_01799 [Candidatus Nitrososphaera evergladensis SR1]|uniref:Uncharacterized protein n=1 Tax=Candidatus Nitrososphaera evergladensis SR1 TaxID=1459636 RepID=A0A075MRY5_9ARCH|nr:hypothetical protein [Candidatus Nitrososphaera evergladensis]AIF83860.1 hypothetical protein NTE_01799 [Candidatus Nitrososphaera evergladensis SR1]